MQLNTQNYYISLYIYIIYIFMLDDKTMIKSVSVIKSYIDI